MLTRKFITVIFNIQNAVLITATKGLLKVHGSLFVKLSSPSSNFYSVKITFQSDRYVAGLRMYKDQFKLMEGLSVCRTCPIFTVNLLILHFLPASTVLNNSRSAK
jgi:hypothetical protein